MRDKRIAAGLSLDDVGRVLGKTRAGISLMELGKVRWSARLADQYEQALREAVVTREHRAAAKAGEQRGEQRKD